MTSRIQEKTIQALIKIKCICTKYRNQTSEEDEERCHLVPKYMPNPNIAHIKIKKKV